MEQVGRSKFLDVCNIEEPRRGLVGSYQNAKILHHIGNRGDRRQEIALQITRLLSKTLCATIECPQLLLEN